MDRAYSTHDGKYQMHSYSLFVISTEQKRSYRKGSRKGNIKMNLE